jgi:hypothetical protein
VSRSVILGAVSLNHWVEAQIAVARSLVGESIMGWDAIEMAVRENGRASKPVFGDPAAPCLQLSMLAVRLLGVVACATVLALTACADLRNHRSMRQELDRVRADIGLGTTEALLLVTMAEDHGQIEFFPVGDANDDGEYGVYEARLEGDPEGTGSLSICWMRINLAPDANGANVVTSINDAECPA